MASVCPFNEMTRCPAAAQRLPIKTKSPRGREMLQVMLGIIDSVNKEFKCYTNYINNKTCMEVRITELLRHYICICGR